MGFYSGRDGELYIGSSSTKAAKIQSWSFSSSMAVLETTSMGDTDRTLKSGVRSYSGSCRLFYYVSDTTSSSSSSNINGLIDAAIKAGGSAGDGENTESSEVVLKLRLTTGSTDQRDIQFSAFITGVSMSTAVGEVASADITWEANGAPYGATTLVN